MLNKTLLLTLLFFISKVHGQIDSSGRLSVHDTTATRNTVLQALPQQLSVTDSTFKKDSAALKQHTQAASQPKVHMLSWQADTAYTRLYRNLYPAGKKGAVFMINSIRETPNKDEIFFILTGLFLLIAILRSGFPKYFQNIFRLFFQSAYRQKQSKESLLHDNLPSLLLNITFLLSGGLLIALLVAGSPPLASFPFWMLWLYTFGTLAIIYIGKYLFIQFCGWAFNVPQFAFNYNFIVFLVNKITGICLLPLLLVMAFSQGQTYEAAVTISLSLVLIMLLYRYIVALNTVVKNLKINAVHFFIYLCAVEILPLLVIYKLLFITIK